MSDRYEIERQARAVAEEVMRPAREDLARMWDMAPCNSCQGDPNGCTTCRIEGAPKPGFLWAGEERPLMVTCPGCGGGECIQCETDPCPTPGRIYHACAAVEEGKRLRCLGGWIPGHWVRHYVQERILPRYVRRKNRYGEADLLQFETGLTCPACDRRRRNANQDRGKFKAGKKTVDPHDGATLTEKPYTDQQAEAYNMAQAVLDRIHAGSTGELVNLFLHGPSNLGKSRVVAALVEDLRGLGHKVHRVQWPDEARANKEKHEDKDARYIKMRDADFLWIEDLTGENFGFYPALSIIRARRQTNRPTFITSNKTAEQIATFEGGELWDFIDQHYEVLWCSWPSRSKRGKF